MEGLIIIQTGEENPKFPLITDGHLQADILSVIGKDEEWLMGEMNKQGYITDSAFDGEDGLDFLECGKYDLIIYDETMKILAGSFPREFNSELSLSDSKIFQSVLP